MLRHSPLKRGTGTWKKSKPLRAKPKTKEQIQENKEETEKMFALYIRHWNSKPHVCESCDVLIWGENLTLYHDHLLEKSSDRYKHLMYNIQNLYLVCGTCHGKKTSGFPTKRHKEAIEQAKIRFDVL